LPDDCFAFQATALASISRFRGPNDRFPPNYLMLANDRNGWRQPEFAWSESSRLTMHWSAPGLAAIMGARYTPLSRRSARDFGRVLSDRFGQITG